MDENEPLLHATAQAVGHELAAHRFLSENVYGDGVIRSYELTLQAPEGDPVSQVVYLQTSPNKLEAQDAQGILVFQDEESGDEVAVWLYPSDPELPALPVAVFPDAARTILQRMGLPFEDVTLQLVAYRPGKRAVVRASSPDGTVWLKVVRPKTVEQLHNLYRVWESAGLPVPQTLGWAAEGLIGFTQLGGVPASSVVDKLDEAFLSSVEALMRRYGAITSPSKARPSLSFSHAWYARKAAAKYPDLADNLDEVSTGIARLLDLAGPPPSDVTIHGDLHLGQLFVSPDDPTEITGILDIDTAGLGDPADDVGAMYAHLIVSHLFERDPNSGRARAFVRLAQALKDRAGDAREEDDPRFMTRFTAIAATHLIAHSLGNLVPAEALVTHARTLLHER